MRPRLIWLLPLALLCMAFEWPGHAERLRHELRSAETARRIEIVRELGSLDAAQAKEALLASLEDPEPSVRLESAAAAGRVGLREALPILRDWLDDPEVAVRVAAVSALGQLADPSTNEQLLRALADTSAEVRRSAIAALEGVDDEAVVPALLGRLDDADVPARAAAVQALARRGDDRAVVALLGRAREADDAVRAEVMRALGAIADARALTALGQALSDDDEHVRVAAAAALGQLGGTQAAERLVAVLGGTDVYLARTAIDALAAIDEPGALDALLGLLDREALRTAAIDAIVARARRTARARAAIHAEGPDPTLDALTKALANERGRLRVDGIARIVEGVAGSLDITSMVEPLSEALAVESARPAVLSALAAAPGPEALLRLLEELGRAEPEARGALLGLLEERAAREPSDSRAADPLLAMLASAAPAEQPQLIALLGHAQAPRVLPALRPLLDANDAAVRSAATRAIGALGDVEANPKLLERLQHGDAHTRAEVADALGHTADVAVVTRLLAWLHPEQGVDRHAALIALGPALARLDGQLPKTTRDAALQSLAALLLDADRPLADRALTALVRWRPPDALKEIARRIRAPSARRRAQAVRALGAFGTEESRMTLRFLLRNSSPRELVAAATATGEVGDARDAGALRRAFLRTHWPGPAAASHGLARLARRGELKTFAAQRTLCEMGASHDPLVRANVAAGLAALAAGPCPNDGPDPLTWLRGPHAAQYAGIRAAAARWADAAARAGRLDAARASTALEHCLRTDVDASVRAACASPSPAGGTEDVIVQARGPDGTTPLPDRLVALRLGDGSIFVGYADANAELQLLNVPAGGMILEQPGQVAREPE